MPEPTAARDGGAMTGSRRWKWWHVALLVVGLGLAAGGAFLAFVYVSLIGGVDELFRGDPPREGDAQVVAAEKEAAQRLDSAVPELMRVTERSMRSDARLLGGGLVGPLCQVGQHNWKIDDDYDLVCDLYRVTVVGVADRSRFHADTAALDAVLRDRGWVDAGFGLERTLDEYWVPGHGSGRVRVPVPGSDGYSMEDLPSGRYRLGAEGRGHILEIAWAEPGSAPGRVTYHETRADLRLAEGGPTSARGMLAEIPPGGYAVVLTESIEYFRE